MNNEKFITEIYEIAFGCSAITKGYSYQEVIDKIREYSDNAYEYEQGATDCPTCGCTEMLCGHNGVGCTSEQ